MTAYRKEIECDEDVELGLQFPVSLFPTSKHPHIFCAEAFHPACPDCGAKLVPSSGCAFCPICGWSKCL